MTFSLNKEIAGGAAVKATTPTLRRVSASTAETAEYADWLGDVEIDGTVYRLTCCGHRIYAEEVR